MADGNILNAFSNQLGPLKGWQWAGIIGVGALALMTVAGKKKGAASSGAAASPTASGEFQSAQSQETVDPVTGERRTSSYQASGPATGWGGSVGLPMGYPMPSSSGDVYVNLPGNTQDMQPANPVGPHFPPKDAPGPAQGMVGGYWWTPMNNDDIGYFGMRSGLALNPVNNSAAMAKIMVANPQINWTTSKPEDLIGTAMYIPYAWLTDATQPHNQPPPPLPPHASLHGPADYTPPVQQTTVSSG